MSITLDHFIPVIERFWDEPRSTGVEFIDEQNERVAAQGADQAVFGALCGLKLTKAQLVALADQLGIDTSEWTRFRRVEMKGELAHAIVAAIFEGHDLS